SLETLRGKNAALPILGDLLMRGTTHHTYQEIRDRLDALKSEIHMGIGRPRGGVWQAGVLPVSVTSDRKHLPAVLELLGEILREPTFPEAEFEIVKAERITALERQRHDPTALTFNALFHRIGSWPKDDPRYVPTIEEAIEGTKGVERDLLVTLHHDLFGAQSAQMAVVGDFDPEEILSVVEKTFGDWRAPVAYVRIPSPFREGGTAGEETIRTPDKKMAMIGMMLNFPMTDTDPDYPALVIANHRLGGSASSRLLDRLRQKEGLSYGAFSFFNANPIDPNAILAAGAICAPQNVERAMAAMREEITKLIAEGLDAQELAEAKESYMLRQQNLFADDDFVAMALAEALFVDRTLAFIERLDEQIERLTPKAVHAAIQRHLDPDRILSVKAGDL
ncbi:MAG: insulinase family protein, partial [Deltaproteobacteria bacterium]